MVQRLGKAARVAAVATLMSLVPLIAAASADELPAAPAYQLGPEDKLRIKVYDWRKDLGDAHEWTALTGDFIVGASGNVFLPLVGEVSALHRTPSDVAHDIASQLQRRFGLAEQPDASVEIAEYRPFYIIGVLEKAGAYPYRPGLTVLQAVGIAGGLSRPRETSLLGFERDAISTRGELRVLSSQRLILLARQARFDAEIKGGDNVSFPNELLARKTDPDASRAMHEEELLFANARDGLSKQTDSLNKTTDLLQHEVVALAAKDAALSHQTDLAKKELDTVAALVTKGLTIVPRQLAIEQNVSQYESGRLDVQLATLRAKQDMARVDRDLVELRQTYRAAALTEARDVMSKLASATAQIETAQTLIYQFETRAPQVIADEKATGRSSLAYRITRVVNGTAMTQDAAEDDSVEPGDTISVEPRETRELVSDQR